MGSGGSSGFTADTSVIRQGAGLIKTAEDYYKGTLTQLQRVSQGEVASFTGGPGPDTNYYRQLLPFDQAFQDLLGALVWDEQRFVTFLGQFHDRLVATAGDYDGAEAENHHVMGRISGVLGGGS